MKSLRRRLALFALALLALMWVRGYPLDTKFYGYSVIAGLWVAWCMSWLAPRAPRRSR